MHRDYSKLASCLPGDGSREDRMRAFVDAAWGMLHGAAISWIGFYLPAGDAMVLGPCRDKPACSPIGLHGACGRAYLSRVPLVVRDVRELGGNYIACDPRDLSEVVIPLFEQDQTCWGVLDVDSHNAGAFDATDVEGLTLALIAAGLTNGEAGARFTKRGD